LPGWGFVSNYEYHQNDRIWICWDPKVLKVDIISKSMQEISCKNEAVNENMVWFHSFVYGANKGVERRNLWHSLQLVKVTVISSPWLIGGDFTVVMNPKEKWGKENLNSYESEFKDCLNNLEVSDLNFPGSFFTWCKSLVSLNLSLG
jgi:IS1 family transposase